MTGPTYAEARMWIVWLRAFTPSDLANAMAIDRSVAEIFVAAAVWHGIIEDIGATANGSSAGYEPIYAYVPLPPGPRHHPHELPPEMVAPGAYAEAPRRGEPVPGTSSAGTRGSEMRKLSIAGRRRSRAGR